MTNSKEEELYVDPYYEEIPAGDEPKRTFDALKAAPSKKNVLIVFFYYLIE